MGCGASAQSTPVGVVPEHGSIPEDTKAQERPQLVEALERTNTSTPQLVQFQLCFEPLKGLWVQDENMGSGRALVVLKDTVLSYSESLIALFQKFSVGERMTVGECLKCAIVFLKVDLDEDGVKSHIFEVSGYPEDDENPVDITISPGEFGTILCRIANALDAQVTGMRASGGLVSQFTRFIESNCAANITDIAFESDRSCIRNPSFFTYPDKFAGTEARCYMVVGNDDGEEFGKIIFALNTTDTPLTSYNFLSLVRGDHGVGEISGKPLSYKNCHFHRVVKGMCVQAGDITDEDGFGGESIYGGEFHDENFLLKHDTEGLLSMANNGPATNTSQFFITTKGGLTDLDGNNVVFGKVLEGMDVVRRIEEVATDEDDVPTETIRILDCGEMVG